MKGKVGIEAVEVLGRGKYEFSSSAINRLDLTTARHFPCDPWVNATILSLDPLPQ